MADEPTTTAQKASERANLIIGIIKDWGTAGILIGTLIVGAWMAKPMIERLDVLITGIQDRQEKFAEKIDSRHEKNLAEIKSFCTAERQAYAGEVKEVVKELRDATVTTKALIGEFRRIGGVSKASAQPPAGPGADGGY